MTNELIITTIVVALISSLAKVIFEKILGPYIPERKKLTSYIRKFLLFILLYVLPIASIILLMTKSAPFDKYFIFAMGFNFFALSMSFSHWVLRTTDRKLIRAHNIIFDQTGIIRDQLGAVGTGFEIMDTLNKRIGTLERDVETLKNKS